MPPICRKGDMNTEGGKLETASSSVFIDGKPVALHPCKISKHNPFSGNHNNEITVIGLSSVIVDGKPVVLKGDPTSCGHPIVQGSSSVEAS